MKVTAVRFPQDGLHRAILIALMVLTAYAAILNGNPFRSTNHEKLAKVPNEFHTYNVMPLIAPRVLGSLVPASVSPASTRLRTARTLSRIQGSAQQKTKQTSRLPVQVPPSPTAAQSDLRANFLRYVELGRDLDRSNALPPFRIETDYARYARVMERYNATLAIGTRLKRTMLMYSFPRHPDSLGELFKGEIPEGAECRLVDHPEHIAELTDIMKRVSKMLSVQAESLNVYAVYPVDLTRAVRGKIWTDLARRGVKPEGLAEITAAFVPTDNDFDLVVKGWQQARR